MENDVFRWVITIGVPALLAWVGKAVLDFLKHQQDRADQSQSAFLEHMKAQAERQVAVMDGALRNLATSLESHTEASKDNNQKLAALLQREEAEISLMQEIATELREARRGH